MDGNYIILANDLSVYELPVKTYLEDNLRLTGTWKGVLMQGKDEIYDVNAVFEEDLDSVFYWTVGVSYWFKTND